MKKGLAFAFLLVNIVFFVMQANEAAKPKVAIQAPPAAAKELFVYPVAAGSALPPPTPSPARPDEGTRPEAPQVGPAATNPPTTEIAAATPPVPPIVKAIPVPAIGRADEAEKLCHELGPFGQGEQLRAVVQRLAQVGIRTVPEERQEQVEKGYWVLLPPAENELAAEANLRRVQAKGVKDAMLVDQGDAKNAISLGIFTFKKSASQRLATLRALGFEPIMERRYEFKPVYWLTFVASQSDESSAPWHKVTAAQAKLTHKTRRCD